MAINNVNVGTAPDNGTGDNLRIGGQKINANFAFLKTYIDNLLQGLKWKQSVLVATTANITLSGEQTIDSVLTSASRVLVKDQTNKTENGIYNTAAGAWTRALDTDTGEELVTATVSIQQITANTQRNWTCTSTSITLGTTDIVWVDFSNLSSGVSFAELNTAISDAIEDVIVEGVVDKAPSQNAVFNALAGKVTQAELAVLEADIANHELRLDNLEQENTSSPTEIISITPNWQSGLTFHPHSDFKVDGVAYSDSRELTAAAAHATLDRFDLLAVNINTKLLEIITGVAGDPSIDLVYDPLIYLPGPFISIKAAATEPDGVSGTTIHDEGGAGDWSTAGAGPDFDMQNPDNPATGIYAIKVISPLTLSQSLPFTPPANVVYVDGMEISYQLDNIVGGSHRWLVSGLKSNGQSGSIWINAPSNYDPASIVYQKLSVGIPSGKLAEISKISLVAGVAGLEYYLDDVRLISGGGAVSGDYVTQEEFNAALALKVDKITGKGLSTEDYTTAEKTKLAGLEGSKFKGTYLSVPALETAHPTAEAGSYAYVDAGVGTDILEYIWDNDDTKWVQGNSAGSTETAATIKTKYESNADTNAFTDAEKTKLANTGTPTEQALTDALTLSWDLATQELAYLLATSAVGNTRTLPNTVIASGQNSGNYQLFFKQDATGGRTILFEDSFTVFGDFNTTANGVTVISIVTRGTDSIAVLTAETPEVHETPEVEELGFAISDEDTALEIGPAKLTFRMPYAMTVTEVRANVKTAPTGANILVDVNDGGLTIFSTRVSIDAGEKTSTTAVTPAVISDATLADDAEITFDIDQIGSTVAGTGLKVWLIGNRI